ncbi:MAG: hypothetical protein ACSLFI_09415 [Solirubrobacterales bacterium]
MCPQHKSETDSEKDLPPGAERFWGQFSESRAGRTGGEEHESASAKPNGDEPQGSHECLEWCPICRSAELLKSTAASPEIRQQIHAIQNEALQVLKAFAATYSERTGSDDPFARSRPDQNGSGNGNGNGKKPEEPTVTDISIE